MSKCKKFWSVFEYTLSASIFFPVFLLFSVLKFDFFRLVRFKEERPVVGDFLGNIILAVPPPLLTLPPVVLRRLSFEPSSVHRLLLSSRLAGSSRSRWHLLHRLRSIVLDAESSQLFERFFWTHFQVWFVVFWLFLYVLLNSRRGRRCRRAASLEHRTFPCVASLDRPPAPPWKKNGWRRHFLDHHNHLLWERDSSVLVCLFNRRPSFFLERAFPSPAWLFGSGLTSSSSS